MLTDLEVRALEPLANPYKRGDSGGLYLLIKPTGGKLWRFDYRFGGKRKTLAFGGYPKVTITAARKLRDAARYSIAQGADPSNAPVVDREGPTTVSSGPTFEEVGKKWFKTRQSGWSLAHAYRIENRLVQDIYPAIGTRPISEITPREMLDAIRKIEGRGAIELAKRIKNYCGEIFRYAIPEGWVDRDPTADIRDALQPAKPKKQRAWLRLGDIPDFRKKLAAYDGDQATRDALELVILTVLRSKEVRFAQKKEFEGLGTAAPLWRISPERMKMKSRPVEHLVPLSHQAARLVARLIDQSPSDFLLPGNATGGVLSENTMIFAMYRLGYRSRATVHGFRSTFSTAANEAHVGQQRMWSVDAIERQLAHVEENEVRASYNTAEYLPERRRLMQWWADLAWPDLAA